ncbi:MAG TPA: tRNA pseudouridine(55) synthase TruB [Mollicutes bacterium]|nr:tRNA pseudouridine(55) synthase TruB [Mollicutes bacterium]
MTGAIIINKPKDITSRDVVNKLNQILETRQIGHTGTLDPLATGVLVCLIGRATKLSNLLTNQDKEYIATFKLGILTDTLDITGNILKEENKTFNKKEIINTINSFKGTYDQEVPIYSAVKVDGKKLYEYARENKDVKLPTRNVSIYNIKVLSIKKDTITIKTKVSKGTYIRSLIRDIGFKLGTYATLTDLERTQVGNFNIKDSYTLDEVLKNKHKLIPVSEILKDYPQEDINPEMLYKVKHGQILNMTINDYILFKVKDTPVALYKKYDKDHNKIKPYVMFYINK